jgi:hypothetical protein
MFPTWQPQRIVCVEGLSTTAPIATNGQCNLLPDLIMAVMLPYKRVRNLMEEGVANLLLCGAARTKIIYRQSDLFPVLMAYSEPPFCMIEDYCKSPTSSGCYQTA